QSAPVDCSRFIRQGAHHDRAEVLKTVYISDIYSRCPGLGIRLAHSPAQTQDALSDKGKPVVRLGRKATGQAWGLIAGLPKKEAASGPSSGERRQSGREEKCHGPQGRG